MGKNGVNANWRDDLRKKEIGEKVLTALEELLEKDEYLLKIGANERSLTAHLGCYLQVL